MTRPSTTSKGAQPSSALLNCPLEIRDQIYEYIVPHQIKIEIRTFSISTVYQLLAQWLPRCMLLNHQIVDEAVALLFRRNTVTIVGTQLSKLETLFSAFPNNCAWKNLRSIQFANEQQYLGSPEKVVEYFAPEGRVYAFAARCPALRRLEVPIAANIVSIPAPLANNTEKHFGFVRALELKNLAEFTLAASFRTCTEPGTGRDWNELFEECLTELRAEIVKRGSAVKVVPKLYIPIPGFEWHDHPKH